MSFDVKYTQPYFAGFHIPQFAPVATDPAFCAMSANFPYLLRMSPCDNIKCQALAAIVNYHNWTQFAMLMSKDDYDNFNKNAGLQKTLTFRVDLQFGIPIPLSPNFVPGSLFLYPAQGEGKKRVPGFVLISKARH